MNWKGRIDAIEPGDIAVVYQRIDRDDTGIDYEVRVTLRSLARGAFEEGEDQHVIWADRVSFGHNDATSSGGAAFVQMAREQERIAAACWERNRR